MRSRTLKTNKYTFMVEDFSSMRELIGITKRRNRNSWAECRPDEDYDYQEELNRLLNGWEEKTEEIMKGLDKVSGVKTMVKKGSERYKDVIGYTPIVADALKGLPKAMNNSRKVYKSKTKIVEIIFDPGAACCEKAERVLAHGIKLLSKIKSLEVAGYRIRLSVQLFKGQPDDSFGYFATVPIKEENQPLDLSRISYPIASVQMLRTFGFYWYEHLPNAKYISGYGRSLYKWDYRSREEALKAIIPKGNQYYVNLDTDIDDMFSPLLLLKEKK